MPGKAEQWARRATFCPEILHRTKRHALDPKPNRVQARGHQLLASAIGGADRGARQQGLRQLQGGTHLARTAAASGQPLAQMPKAPSAPDEISTHAGIARPSRRQSTLAHSPEPASTLASTSPGDMNFSMTSSGAPQSGMLPGGRL